jgi:hypothetical protein
MAKAKQAAQVTTQADINRELVGALKSLGDRMAGLELAVSVAGRAPGKTAGTGTKGERKALRASVGASNSAKFVCKGAKDQPCKGWGVNDTFRAKHEGRGHVVVALR